MGVGAYAEKAMLDWLCGGAAVTRPTTRALGLSLGTPSSISASEMSVAGYSRQIVTFAAAASPGGSLTNVSAVAFTFSASAGTVRGVQLWDTRLASGSGHMLYYGQVSPTICSSGDTLTFAAGALAITLG